MADEGIGLVTGGTLLSWRARPFDKLRVTNWGIEVRRKRRERNTPTERRGYNAD
jgi:hypothetical protein